MILYHQAGSGLKTTAAAVIERIIAARSIGSLSDDDRILLAVCVAIQIKRVPNRREPLLTLDAAFRKILGERVVDPARGNERGRRALANRHDQRLPNARRRAAEILEFLEFRISSHQRLAEHLAYVQQHGLAAVVSLVSKDGKPFNADPRGGPWASVLRLCLGEFRAQSIRGLPLTAETL